MSELKDWLVQKAKAVRDEKDRAAKKEREAAERIKRQARETKFNRLFQEFTKEATQAAERGEFNVDFYRIPREDMSHGPFGTDIGGESLEVAQFFKDQGFRVILAERYGSELDDYGCHETLRFYTFRITW